MKKPKKQLIQHTIFGIKCSCNNENNCDINLKHCPVFNFHKKQATERSKTLFNNQNKKYL